MWHMGRFAGYVGVINYMGGRFMTEPNALRPIFAELKKRGLLFLEDGASNRSATDDVGKIVGLPVRRAYTIIDGKADAASIAAALAALESRSPRHGHRHRHRHRPADNIDAVAQWARTLGDRGIILIPVSAAYRGRNS